MGESLDDTVAMYRANREESQARRASNRERSANLLSEHDVDFETKNGGAHLIVKGAGKTFDFWPGTGKYVDRQTKKLGCGVFNLLRALGIAVQPKTKG